MVELIAPAKVMDIELGEPLKSIFGLEGYTTLQLLVRLHGSPIGYVALPVKSGSCSANDIRRTVVEKLSWAIVVHLVEDALSSLDSGKDIRIEDILSAQHPVANNVGHLPLVTVAVCTRDNAGTLDLCLESATRLDYPHLDLLVVDNAPSSKDTEVLVRSKYPNIRYVCEPRPGLNWARNRAVVEARGEIVAYADDDVVIDSNWVRALVAIFAENDHVMAVTGLVAPYEFETEAQVLFEKRGGFGKGFRRKWFNADNGNHLAWRFGGAGQFGTGANMAFRRSLFDKIGFFDPALDVGTATNGGGDLDIFFRVIKEGHALVYEPEAVVFHRHRRAYSALRTQMANWGIGFSSYLVRNALTYPDERLAFFRLGSWWFRKFLVRRQLRSYVRPPAIPRDLIRAEMVGSVIGLFRYQKARKMAVKIEKRFGSATNGWQKQSMQKRTSVDKLGGIALRAVDFSKPINALTDVTAYNTVRVYIKWKERILGSVDICNSFQAISAIRLRDQIIDLLVSKLPDIVGIDADHLFHEQFYMALARRYLKQEAEDDPVRASSLPSDVPVSIVLATYDRPEELRECLASLFNQDTERCLEIIVVDNNPSSGLTTRVISDFPGVVLVRETRKGLSYARNAGIAVSRGDIIIATDDDVIMPRNWLEKLVAPFSRSDVMVVTGNVLPHELETEAQQLFEMYGGLGRGFERREVDKDWFDSFRRHAVPTWTLGATANAAFSSTIFSNPQIGLMCEALGPGMPSGVGEDTYLFYKVIKAGQKIVYEPEAYVWHKHRRGISDLRNQIYNYSKGHVAYHLTTLIRDNDLRALVRLLVEMPRWHIWRIKEWLRGRMKYPLPLILLEIKGYIVGPWALWRSCRRVKREGRSESVVTSGERLETPWKQIAETEPE